MTDGGEMRLSEEQLRTWAQTEQGNPLMARMWPLIVDYAKAKGGRTLEVWRLFMGPAFGEPQVTTPPVIAEKLGVAQSDVAEVFEATFRDLQRELSEIRRIAGP